MQVRFKTYCRQIVHCRPGCKAVSLLVLSHFSVELGFSHLLNSAVVNTPVHPYTLALSIGWPSEKGLVGQVVSVYIF